MKRLYYLLDEYCLFVHLFVVIIMDSEFSKERDKARARGDFKKTRDQKIFDEELKGYLEWITHGG